MSPDTDRPSTVADLLLDRLAGLGLDRLFGVPGDYSLRMLDHVVAHPRITWTGGTNELNAGYAADGYARMRGIGAVCTTFGVGELSAMNAIAGAYAEYVPVLHVVGAPATVAQDEHRRVHHTLGDGLFRHFADMYGEITCAGAVLTAENAVTEIDRVLGTMMATSRPGYLLIAADVAEAPVAADVPAPPRAVATSDAGSLAAFTASAARLFEGIRATDEMCVLAGLLVHRLGGTGALQDLLGTDVPHASTLWSKSVVDESAGSFLGTYVGAAGPSADVRDRVEQAGVLVVAGVQFTDLNTGLFSFHLRRAATIELEADRARVGEEVFDGVVLTDALRAITPLVRGLTRGIDSPPPASAPTADGDAWGQTALAPGAALLMTEPAAAGGAWGQTALWNGISDALRPDDIVAADQGTSFYGMGTHRLPSGVTFLGQPLWASIGWSLPALLGACLASPGRRGVLLIGDGAAQMTAQELTTFARTGVAPVVVVVDNDGYTVERAIHGPTEPYNDIARWDWTAAPQFLGLTGWAAHRVTSADGLAEALAEHDRTGAGTVLQAVVPADDVPELLATLTRMLGAPVRP
ncbi:indolepyruvate decarboxylase [Nakamurella sp. YIM 132087]|uniref:Alpha-keto-acid decarboxylase n=1 Tax=Nakamurella alba TaxID=2665158 RepID=A0A7K1FPC3_9ACTN|nr:thiamine pyrophosphate-binding protein [Nakamurella alba]MTD15996.1 indolepyruvate decarboxylase [Nakamurella alba]